MTVNVIFLIFYIEIENSALLMNYFYSDLDA
jgi:hypothetical protein